jgi:hypothetical protein
MAVHCYIEEYTTDRGAGARLREKGTRRKVEITAFTMQERDEFLAFLLAPRLSGAAGVLQNLYEPIGLDDFVLVDGNVEVDNSDVIRFTYDGALSYLIG